MDPNLNSASLKLENNFVNQLWAIIDYATTLALNYTIVM